MPKSKRNRLGKFVYTLIYIFQYTYQICLIVSLTATRKKGFAETKASLVNEVSYF